MSSTSNATGHIRISNDWLNANAQDKNAVIDCRYPDGDPRHDSWSTGRGNIPKAIMIDGDTSGSGNTGTVRGYLWGENSSSADDYSITPNMLHPLGFRAIYARGTTARGVRVFY